MKKNLFQGTWAFQSLEVDGQAIPSDLLAHSRMLIAGDRFRMDSPEATHEGTFTMGGDHIDIDFNTGPEAGRRCEGLFHLDGDRLTV